MASITLILGNILLFFIFAVVAIIFPGCAFGIMIAYFIGGGWVIPGLIIAVIGFIFDCVKMSNL